MKITDILLNERNTENAAFQHKLAPTLPVDVFLGIKVPELRQIEKQYRGTPDENEFLASLPHRYYDENLLHSVFISNMKDYKGVMDALDRFLPYVDNWAVCDTLHPSVFKKHKDGLIEKVREWISSPETYVCRFGIDVLMTYYLDADFCEDYLEYPAAVRSDEYYVNMMIAWFYTTALTKHWDAALPYLTEEKLSPWVHNKTIQKARESYCFTTEQKEYLNTLKR